jgi:magnesium transporter
MQSATLTPELLDRLTRDPLQLASTLPATHPADLARVLETMQPAVAAHVVAALPADVAGSVLAQPPLRRPERVVEHLGDRFLTPVLHAMPPAALAALLRRTHGSERDRLFGLVDDVRRQAVTPLLEYRSDAVAAAMTTGSVELPGSWTAVDACAHIATLDHGDSAMAAIHVLDASGRVSHALPIATLLRASRDQRLRDLTPRAPHVVVAPTLPVREAADLLSHYGLAVVPVVSDDGRLLGELRADRALHVLAREQANARRVLAVAALLVALATLAALLALLNAGVR